MWILILLAVSIHNPRDVPGKIELEFKTQEQCLEILSTLKYDLKFKTFKIEGQCIKKS